MARDGFWQFEPTDWAAAWDGTVELTQEEQRAAAQRYIQARYDRLLPYATPSEVNTFTQAGLDTQALQALLDLCQDAVDGPVGGPDGWRHSSRLARWELGWWDETRQEFTALSWVTDEFLARTAGPLGQVAWMIRERFGSVPPPLAGYLPPDPPAVFHVGGSDG